MHIKLDIESLLGLRLAERDDQDSASLLATSDIDIKTEINAKIGVKSW